jgi:hypothetical protein
MLKNAGARFASAEEAAAALDNAEVRRRLVETESAIVSAANN